MKSEELFESIPELANEVYEAAGFKPKADVILPIGTSGSGKSTFIKSLPQENLVIIEPDAMRVEFTGDINDKSKDKEIYIEAANRAIKAIKQGKQVVFDTTNLTKDKRLPFIEAIKKAIPTANIQYKLMELNPELAKQRIKAQLERGENRAAVSDETIDRHTASYKQMLEDIKNEPITKYKDLKNNIEQTCIEFGRYVADNYIESNFDDIDFMWEQFQELQAKKVLDILDDIQSNNKSDDLEFGSTQAKINHEMLMLVKELQAQNAKQTDSIELLLKISESQQGQIKVLQNIVSTNEIALNHLEKDGDDESKISKVMQSVPNIGYDCSECGGTSQTSYHCENPSCPNMPCCGKTRDNCCKEGWGSDYWIKKEKAEYPRTGGLSPDTGPRN